MLGPKYQRNEVVWTVFSKYYYSNDSLGYLNLISAFPSVIHSPVSWSDLSTRARVFNLVAMLCGYYSLVV